MYFVSWSVPFFFVIVAGVSSGLLPFSDVGVAVLKAKFMVLAVVAGTICSLCILALRKFKKNEKISLIHLMRTTLLPLAYFTFYFGMSKFVVTGICLAGIAVGVLSAQEMMRNRTNTSSVRV